MCPTNHHNRFTALFPGPPGWAGARRELLDFMVQEKINRGRHNHPAGRHSIRTNQCPPSPSPIFYRPDALPAAEPTVSKQWRQLVHSIREKTLEFSSTVLPAPSPYLWACPTKWQMIWRNYVTVTLCVTRQLCFTENVFSASCWLFILMNGWRGLELLLHVNIS